MAAEREIDLGMSLDKATGALRMTANQTREALSKGAARAARMAAGEATYLQVQLVDLAAGRQVGSPST